MISAYCKACKAKETACLLPDSHRALGKHIWCADFLLGGKHGKRIRKMFKAGVSKKEVEKFEHLTIADFERGTFIPTDKSKTPLAVILDKYNTEHILEQSRHPQGPTKYYIKELKNRLGHVAIGNTTLDVLLEARSAFKEDTGASNAHVNRCFSVLKAALNYALQHGIISKNPAQFLKPLPVKEPKPRFLTTQEISRLYAVTKDDRLIKRMNALLHTGIRPINLDQLNWTEVDLKNRVIQITTYKGRKAHTYPVPIDDTLLKDLEERYRATGGSGLVYDSSNLRKLADQAILDAGINEGKPEDEQFTIYGLKHSYASHLLMSGATIFDVAKLLGHTDTAMIIRHYGHLTQEHLRAVQSRINLTPTLQPEFKVI